MQSWVSLLLQSRLTSACSLSFQQQILISDESRVDSAIYSTSFKAILERRISEIVPWDYSFVIISVEESDSSWLKVIDKKPSLF